MKDITSKEAAVNILLFLTLLFFIAALGAGVSGIFHPQAAAFGDKLWNLFYGTFMSLGLALNITPGSNPPPPPSPAGPAALAA